MAMQDQSLKKNISPIYSLIFDLPIGTPDNTVSEPDITGGIAEASYKELLTLWPEVTFEFDLDESREWRKQFVDQLKTHKHDCTNLISSGSGTYKAPIRAKLVEVDGDPIAFLNVSGISPLVVLHQLVELHYRLNTPLPLHKMLPGLTSKYLASHCRQFVDTAQALVPYGLAFDENDKDELASLVQDVCDKLKRIAGILKSREIDVGIRPHGAPFKEEFREAIGILVEICKPKLTELYGRNGSRISSVAIAAILMCAFPKKFTPENAARLVKDAYRQWCRDHAGELISLIIANSGNLFFPLAFKVPQPKRSTSRRKRCSVIKGKH